MQIKVNIDATVIATVSNDGIDAILDGVQSMRNKPMPAPGSMHYVFAEVAARFPGPTDIETIISEVVRGQVQHILRNEFAESTGPTGTPFSDHLVRLAVPKVRVDFPTEREDPPADARPVSPAEVG